MATKKIDIDDVDKLYVRDNGILRDVPETELSMQTKIRECKMPEKGLVRHDR